MTESPDGHAGDEEAHEGSTPDENPEEAGNEAAPAGAHHHDASAIWADKADLPEAALDTREFHPTDASPVAWERPPGDVWQVPDTDVSLLPVQPHERPPTPPDPEITQVSEPVPDPGPAPTPDFDAPPLLSVRGLDVAYGQVQVLFEVDLDVHENEIVALLGTNGAGKSTVLKAVSGLVKPKGGSITFDGDDVTRLSANATARRGIAYMPGGKGVFPTLTVEENLRLAGWMLRGRRTEYARARTRVLDLFPVLGKRLRSMAGNMSGGEQQMLALAQSFINNPRLMLIDELSLGLAPTVVGQLLEVVRGIHREGCTIVVVEQSINVALTLAERAVFMEKGEVRFSGPAADLLERPDILRSVFIQGDDIEDGPDGGTSGADATGAGAGVGVASVYTPSGAATPPGEPDTSWGEPESPVVDTGVTTSVTAAPGSASGNGDQPVPVIECRAVVKRFGGINAVDGVDLELQEGQILGLIGQNGAGKTTLLDCISGFHRIDEGRIYLRGFDISEWSPSERARSRLGRSFQEARLYPSLTVAETLSVAYERHVTSRAVIADAMQLPAAFESELATAGKVDELVELTGLSAYREKQTGELSTGTRRIVELACLLAMDPVALCLDEPSAGVAQKETEALGPLLKRVRDRLGCSIVVIEHDMPLLKTICDEMIALELGGVIARGTPNEVLSHPQVVESYLGTDDAAINRSGARAPSMAGPPPRDTGGPS